MNVVVDDDRFYLWVTGSPSDRITDLAIECDPMTKAFVGKEEDTFVVPVPGQPRRRRSAVAVVAERIVGLIAEQSQAMRRAR